MKYQLSLLSLLLLSATASGQSVDELKAFRKDVTDLLTRVNKLIGPQGSTGTLLKGENYKDYFNQALAEGKPLVVFVNTPRSHVPKNALWCTSDGTHWVGWSKAKRFVIIAVPHKGELKGNAYPEEITAQQMETEFVSIKNQLVEPTPAPAAPTVGGWGQSAPMMQPSAGGWSSGPMMMQGGGMPMMRMGRGAGGCGAGG